MVLKGRICCLNRQAKRQWGTVLARLVNKTLTPKSMEHVRRPFLIMCWICIPLSTSRSCVYHDLNLENYWKFTEGQSSRLQPVRKSLLPSGLIHATKRSHSFNSSDKNLLSRETSGGRKRSWSGHCPALQNSKEKLCTTGTTVNTSQLL